ncbi:hypothetical protein BGZ70_007153 [Mortierella alpina]|uniref:Uncharacterized protein n=1 Tax=Mortierella alpina TaxID=64518 RepID=A0A9P6J6P4_MORAP|nr:hypothetical protein BGZ70_007153 [Mortierella alpina]
MAPSNEMINVQEQIQALKARIETAQADIANYEGYIACSGKCLLEGGDNSVVQSREEIRKNLNGYTVQLKNFVVGTMATDIMMLRELEHKMTMLEKRIKG